LRIFMFPDAALGKLPGIHPGSASPEHTTVRMTKDYTHVLPITL